MLVLYIYITSHREHFWSLHFILLYFRELFSIIVLFVMKGELEDPGLHKPSPLAL